MGSKREQPLVMTSQLRESSLPGCRRKLLGMVKRPDAEGSSPRVQKLPKTGEGSPEPVATSSPKEGTSLGRLKMSISA